MCRIMSGVDVDATNNIELTTVAPQQAKALDRRRKQRLRKRYFRALDVGREPPEEALLLGDELLHRQAQPHKRSTTQAAGANRQKAPEVHSIDAVVTEAKRAPTNTAPPPALAAPPIQLIEKSQATPLQPSQIMSGPMLWCAVQDVRPVMECVAVPMVVVNMVPAVLKERLGADTVVVPSKQCMDVSQGIAVEATSRIPHIEHASDRHTCIREDRLPKEFVLPVSIKKTFFEVEDPLMNDGEDKKSCRAQSVPSRHHS